MKKWKPAYYFLLVCLCFVWGNTNDAFAQNCLGGLTVSLSGAVLSMPLTIDNVTTQNVACFGGNNGSISLSVNGGSPNYTYSWVDNPTLNTSSRNNLTAGTYEVYVTDINACTKTQSIVITEPNSLITNASATAISICNGSSTMLQASATGGNSTTYNFSWDNGIGNSSGINPIVSPTATTTYTVTVTDANGCFTTSSVTISVTNSANAGVPLAPLTVCTMENTPISLASLLSGQDAGGTWTAATTVTGFDPLTATFTPLGNAEGTYNFSYTVGGAPCSPVSATVTVVLENDICPIRANLGDFTATSMGTNNVGTCFLANGTQWIDVFDSNGNLVFSINPNGNNLGATCWGVRVENNANPRQITSILNGNPYNAYFLDRNIYITPTNQPDPNVPVSIRLYVLDAELTRFLNALNITVANIGVTRFNGTATSSVDLDPLNNVTGTAPMSSVAAYLSQSTSAFYNHWVLTYETNHFSEFIPTHSPSGAPGVFPVTLLSFTGKQVGAQHLLEWQTSSEINSSSFEIEFSIDGVAFATIGSVAAAGSSTELKNYEFTNTKPAEEVSYYRLKMVDINGAFQYSNIISLKQHKITLCTIYPNPVNDWLTVNIEGIVDKYTLFELYSPTGALILSERWNVQGNTIRKIDVSKYSNGNYAYFLTNREGVFSGKVVIRHD
ncbi:MAG: T9SS type A sorting domain-containing protein [Bacteroidia bacterium]